MGKLKPLWREVKFKNLTNVCDISYGNKLGFTSDKGILIYTKIYTDFNKKVPLYTQFLMCNFTNVIIFTFKKLPLSVNVYRYLT